MRKLYRFTFKNRNIKSSSVLILLCWLVYACSYLGKVNYSANINQIMEFYNVDHSSAGFVSTAFFFAYGIGQVINGLLCKKYNIKWIVFFSLIVSGLINLIVGLTYNFAIIKFLWLINGLSMSILWPSLIRLLAETLNTSSMAKASIVMGTTVAVGTFFIYFLSALFVKLDFKLAFYLPATMLFIVALIWGFSFSTLIQKVKNKPYEDVEEVKSAKANQQIEYNQSTLMLCICTLAIFGVATNLIKDGLITWIPSILKEQYNLGASISIILTLALPVVSIFANAFGVRVHKRIGDFVLQCSIMFLISGAIISGVIAGIVLNYFIITLIGFTVVCFLISSCNSVITSIFPLLMKEKVNSGRIAGVLNGCCYLGSTISSYGLGAIADNFGWISVFWCLLSVCAFVTSCTIGYLLLKNITRKKV